MSKRRGNGEGSFKKRADGTWEGSIMLPTKKRKSVYGKTMKIVKEKLKNAVEEALKELERQQHAMTLGEWADIWLTDYLNVKPSTAARYELDIRKHIKPALGEKLLIDLTTRDIQHLYRTKENDGLSLKSIKNIHGVLHSMLDQATKEKLIPHNISNECKVKPAPRRKMNPLKDDNVKKFIRAIQGNKYENFLYVMMFTGMRRGEMLGLTWDCVDFANGTIYIYRQWAKLQKIKGGIDRSFQPLKNSKTRIVKPAVQVMDKLREVKRSQNISRLACGAGWHEAADFVFTDNYGFPYNGDMVYKEFKKIVSSIGVGETRLHDLRHTYATLSLQNGTDIKTVSESLGHATTAFTMDQYGDVTERMLKDSSDRMSKLIDEL